MNNKKYHSDMDVGDQVGRLDLVVPNNIHYCILVGMTYIIDSVMWCDQVFNNENRPIRPWNFINRWNFWSKKISVEHHASKGETSGELTKEGSSAGPAVEAISLEMKQQELDCRWKH